MSNLPSEPEFEQAYTGMFLHHKFYPSLPLTAHAPSSHNPYAPPKSHGNLKATPLTHFPFRTRLYPRTQHPLRVQP